MLTVLAPQAESLWDEALPIEVRELPADLAALDSLLDDHELLRALVERWQREFELTGRRVLSDGLTFGLAPRSAEPLGDDEAR